MFIIVFDSRFVSRGNPTEESDCFLLREIVNSEHTAKLQDDRDDQRQSCRVHTHTHTNTQCFQINCRGFCGTAAAEASVLAASLAFSDASFTVSLSSRWGASPVGRERGWGGRERGRQASATLWDPCWDQDAHWHFCGRFSRDFHDLVAWEVCCLFLFLLLFSEPPTGNKHTETHAFKNQREYFYYSEDKVSSSPCTC